MRVLQGQLAVQGNLQDAADLRDGLKALDVVDSPECLLLLPVEPTQSSGVRSLFCRLRVVPETEVRLSPGGGATALAALLEVGANPG